MSRPSPPREGAATLRFGVLLACFVLSGTAGLIYQTAWMQELSLVFGASELAVASVLAAYMAGLTAGALIAGRWLVRLARPILGYALLELVIALSALATPAGLELAGRLRVWLFAGEQVGAANGPASAVFYLVCTFGVLFVPTACMGATLPLLTRWAVRRDRQLGPRIAVLYGANTAGAAGGVVAAAFWLLPTWGLGATVWAAIGLNLLVFLLALCLARDPAGEGEAGSSEPEEEPSGSGQVWVLPAILVSGFVAFGWEILWTRLLSHLLGGSIYAFGAMLATFLVGIAAGSLLVARWARDVRRARSGFVWAQLGVAGASWTAFAGLDTLAERLSAGGGQPFEAVSLASLTLFPGALMMGAAFPCAVRLAAGGADDAGRASARVYAWNTLGAITGAIGVGFWLLPALRFAAMATVLVACSLAVGWLGAVIRPPRLPMASMSAAFLGMLLGWYAPGTPWRTLRTAPLSGEVESGETAFYAVGRSATVLLHEKDRGLRLTTNGLPESLIQPAGVRPGRLSIVRWLGMLPPMVRDDVESMMIVGLGGGITASSVPPSVREIHVVELEPQVAAANAQASSWRGEDPLADPRVHLHFDDARSALQLTTRTFDAIVSQPSHPWTAGASHLFTRELFELVSRRLSDDGVFVQWIGSSFVDEALSRSLIATLLDVFPHVEVFSPPPGGALLFVASRAPFELGEGGRQRFARDRALWRRIGVADFEQWTLARSLDREASRSAAAAAELITDRRNLLQTRSPRLANAPRGGEVVGLLAEHDVLRRSLASGEAVSVVRRLLDAGHVERARRSLAAIEDRRARRTARAVVAMATGRPKEADRLLRQVLGSRLPCSDEVSREAAAARLRLAHRSPSLGGGFVLAELAAVCGPEFERIVEGWRRSARRDFGRVRELDGELAALAPSHPMHRAAVELRIGWRLESNRAALHREALELLEASMPPRPRDVRQLVWRVVLAAGAGDGPRLWDAVRELTDVAGQQAAVLRRAQQGLGRVSTDGLAPADDLDAAWRQLQQ